jgi:hypothetical protein
MSAHLQAPLGAHLPPVPGDEVGQQLPPLQMSAKLR